MQSNQMKLDGNVEKLQETPKAKKSRMKHDMIDQISIKLRDSQASMLMKLAKNLKIRRANASISDFVSAHLSTLSDQDYEKFLVKVTPKQFLIKEKLNDPEFAPLMDQVMTLGPKGRERLLKYLNAKPKVSKKPSLLEEKNNGTENVL